MKKIAYILLIFLPFLPPTYLVWGTLPAGMETFNAGQGIRRDGTGSVNALNATSTTTFGVTDTLYAVINASGAGAFNMVGLSSVTPVNADPTALNEDNPNVKYSFYHGNESGNLYLRTVENGATDGYSETLNSNYYLRIIYSPGQMRYERSADGVTYTLHRNSVYVPSGNYYVFVQLQNPGTFSAFNQIYISRGPGTSTESSRALKWYNQ